MSAKPPRRCHSFSFSASENYLSPSNKKQFLSSHYKTLNDVLCWRLSLYLSRLPCWRDNLLTAFFSKLLPCSSASHLLSGFLDKTKQNKTLQKSMIIHGYLGEAQTAHETPLRTSSEKATLREAHTTSSI